MGFTCWRPLLLEAGLIPGFVRGVCGITEDILCEINTWLLHPYHQRTVRQTTHILVTHCCCCINPFTTIHDGNFRRHSSMYVTIHNGNFRRIYYSYTRIRGSWYALRPGSEEVKFHCIALHCIALHCIALHCIALHCIALHCIALHRVASCRMASHFIMSSLFNLI